MGAALFFETVFIYLPVHGAATGTTSSFSPPQEPHVTLRVSHFQRFVLIVL
jgi:hypothetical protein